MITKLKDIVQFPDLIQDKITYSKFLNPDFDAYLQNYLNVFEAHRQQTALIPATEEDWKLLPFGPFATSPDWKWRRESWAILQRFMRNRNFGCTLEIGPWNGWLTKSLAATSDTVVGADYFVTPYDGIGNLQTLSGNILAVQCNVSQISEDFKAKSFDLIVLNHCLSFTENPVEYAQKLIPLLKENGKIISLGNTFYTNSSHKISEIQQQAKTYLDNYGLDLYITPVKGYMDTTDKKTLTDLGFNIKTYPNKWLQNLYSKLNSKAPSYHYLVFQH